MSNTINYPAILREPPEGIEILLDKTRQITGGDIPMYTAENEYFTAYATLQAAIKQQRNMRVIVHSQALKTWLVQGLSKYPQAVVTEKELTFRDLLAAKWQISTFDLALSDAQIRQQKLLELPVEGLQPQPLSAFLCQTFLSPHLDNPRCPVMKFGELLTDLLDYQQHRDRLPGIVHTMYKQRLRDWAEHSPECADILRELQENIEAVYIACCVYRLTAKYPQDVRAKCLDAHQLNALQHAGVHLNGLELTKFEQTSSPLKTRLLDELRLFFHAFDTRHPTPTTTTIEELLGYCSGALSQEVDHLLRVLKGNMHLITVSLVTHLKTVFTALLPLYNHTFEELRACVPPQKPTPFPQDADTSAAVAWAVDEYLPYKFWLENHPPNRRRT